MTLPFSITLIPFFQNSSDVLFFFFIMGRVTGFFLISPFFSNRNIIPYARIGLIFFITAIMTMVLYSDYRGPNALFTLPPLEESAQHLWIFLAVTFLKELVIGYLIGFCFSLMFESVLVAGQALSNLAGLSAVQLVDPVRQTPSGLTSQLFNLTLILLFLSMDYHLDLLKTFHESFSTLPLGHYQMPFEVSYDLTHGTGRIFHYALRFVAAPFLILFLVTISLGFMARVMPEMNVFLVGFPLKILVNFYSLMVAIKFFPILVRPLFIEYQNLANLIIYRMSGSS